MNLYSKKLTEWFGLNQRKWFSIPFDANVKLSYEEGSLLDPKPYRSLIESLLYLNIMRLDIAFSIGYVNVFIQSSQKPHLKYARNYFEIYKLNFRLRLIFQKES